MKNASTSKSSQNLLGALLLFGLLGTGTLTCLENLAELGAACKCQWDNFSESLMQLQPHRTVFPN